MDKEKFIERLREIKTVRSVTGKIYNSIEVLNNKVYFIRNNNIKSESFSLDELYDFYTRENNNIINTAVAKKYITKRAQSPAVAILLKLISNRLLK